METICDHLILDDGICVQCGEYVGKESKRMMVGRFPLAEGRPVALDSTE